MNYGFKKSVYNIESELFDYEKNLKPRFLTTNYVDLRNEFMPKIYESQYNTGRCTVWALIALLEYMYNKNSEIKIPHLYSNGLSKNFAYFETRYDSPNHSVNIDSGIPFVELFKSVIKHGVCVKDLHSDSMSNMKKIPSHEAMNNAPNITIKAFYKINTLEGIIDCLNRGIPVIYGYDSKIAKACDKNGNLPKDFNWNQKFKSNHAGLLVGNLNGLGITRNSWGKDFGDNGYFYFDLKKKFENSFDDAYCIIVENNDYLENPNYFKHFSNNHNLPDNVVILNKTAYDLDFANDLNNYDLIKSEKEKTKEIIIIKNGKIYSNSGKFITIQNIKNSVGKDSIIYKGKSINL